MTYQTLILQKQYECTICFDGCINLEYINLINFRENNLNKNFSYSIFDNVPDNIVLCINDNINIILDEIKKIKCYSLNCSDNWQLAQKKLAEENGNCMESCLNKYEYNGKCYGNCLNGDYLENSISKCKCELIKCFTCSNVSLSKEYVLNAMIIFILWKMTL